MTVCVAIDRLRPCRPAGLLVFHLTQSRNSSPLAADAQTQEGSIDERAPLHIPTVVGSSRIVEDEQDEEMSDLTQITSAEKRNEIHTGESAKELRALLPISASSHPGSLRPDGEIQEQLVRSATQA